MTDIVLEVLRALIVLLIVLFIYHHNKRDEIKHQPGWRSIKFGFILILFGALIDITDNFSQLNQFVVIGDTPIEAILEKVVGYLAGFILLAYGLWKWLPTIAELSETREALKLANDTLEEKVVIRTKELCDEIEIRQQTEETNKALIAELEQSLSEIKELQGILPICSYCKQIRDDEGYWQQLETYISQNSLAEFTHGICPNCIEQHYPDIADKMLSPNSKLIPKK